MTWNLEYTYKQLPDHFYSEEKPVQPEKAEVVLLNTQLAQELGLSWLTDTPELAADFLSGKKTPAIPLISQAYAGHQFGHFTILGDGRAILLGEHVTPSGERIDIQLKGAGRTKYSRRGDGMATLYSMLREYLISESMHFLGIPSTRSLAVVKNGIPVYRETPHEGAVLTRIASSHIRTGTFEYARQFGSVDDVKQLLDYTIERHYPDVKKEQNLALGFLKRVMLKQIDLIVHWMRVGFIHGVMNTDNMSISGETIDYGPCAFMNTYNPQTVFSSIDHNGRYAFGNQPNIALWNTSILAGMLLPLIDQSETKATKLAATLLKTFEGLYKEKWYRMMSAKMGIVRYHETDKVLVKQLLELLGKHQTDYAHFFLNLENEHFPEESLYTSDEFKRWRLRWKERITEGQLEVEALETMQMMNPSFIPRNHLVEQALSDAVNGDWNAFNSLLESVKNPYSRRSKIFEFEKVPLGYDESYQTFCGT